MNGTIKAIIQLEVEETAAVERSCSVAGRSHCITCSDEALAVKVLQVAEELALAQVELNGEMTEIDISLVTGVSSGDLLLVHGGVALERLTGGEQ